MSLLYPDEFRAELARLPTPHPSFLVSLCTREEAAIQTFRGQIESWFGKLPDDARDALRERLTTLDNDRFFQGFAEMVVHEALRRGGHQVPVWPVDGGEPLTVTVGDTGEAFSLVVQSYIPEVQVRGGMSAFRHLLRELGEIEHHFFFSVYLKRWLPYNFDPRPIRKALEVWLNSLDEGLWEGKYAEYRDEHIHLEFSILERVPSDRKGLVRFRIPPLRAPALLQELHALMRARMGTLQDRDPSMPLVLVLFGNESWGLPENYLHDFMYGKCAGNFNWTTLGGRPERVKSFRRKSKGAVFCDPDLAALSAVLFCDKEWERDRVVFTMRLLHNPWARAPLKPEAFEGFTQFRPLAEGDEVVFLGSDVCDGSRVDLG
ncbi:hypothetical protein L6R50_21420 [Myxococcota bacterium]|nr:hypothetical protein [Myxococcota bacterium]